MSLIVFCSHCRKQIRIEKWEKGDKGVLCSNCGQRYNIKVIEKAHGIAIFVDEFGIPTLSHYHNDGSGFHHG